jgi:hypothetical protein
MAALDAVFEIAAAHNITPRTAATWSPRFPGRRASWCRFSLMRWWYARQVEAGPIPDRWLVIRMFPSPRVPSRRAIQGWVLRTGEKEPVVVDLDQWTSQERSKTPKPR